MKTRTLGRLDLIFTLITVLVAITYFIHGLPQDFFLLLLAVFAIPHFAITIFLYESKKFRSSIEDKRWVFLYIFVPVVLMASIFLLRTIADYIPTWIVLLIVIAVRIFDAYHVQRQYFGVSLLCAPAKSQPEVRRRNLWHLIFAMMWTLNAFSFFYYDKSSILLICCAAFIFLCYCIDRFRMNPVISKHFLSNILVVGVSFLLPFIDLKLYVLSILSHYVEYIYLFSARFLSKSLFYSTRGVFFIVGSMLSGFFALYSLVITGGIFSAKWSTGDVLKLFLVMDGLFILHYYLDSLIWKTNSKEYGNELKAFYRGDVSV